MSKAVRRYLVVAAIGLFFLFVLFVVNQIAQIVALANEVSPLAGRIALWTLTTLALFFTLFPLYLVMRLPRALVPPVSESDPSFPKYVEQLKARLRHNPHLAQRSVETREELEEALAFLGEKADEVARRTALRVLVSTAVFQNGSLDAFAVLAAQSRMVYQIATIYYQRPSVAELIRLYGNVVASAFMARQLEELDLAEYMQPVISVVGTSMAGSMVPVAERVVSLVTASLLQGSANAYLTLRVAVITKRYCSSLVQPSRRSVTRSAAVEAARMIPALVKEASAQVFGAVMLGLKERVVTGTGAAAKGIAEKVKEVSEELAKGFGQAATALYERLRRQERAEGMKERT